MTQVVKAEVFNFSFINRPPKTPFEVVEFAVCFAGLSYKT